MIRLSTRADAEGRSVCMHRLTADDAPELLARSQVHGTKPAAIDVLLL
jgi:hypothetical protein